MPEQPSRGGHRRGDEARMRQHRGADVVQSRSPRRRIEVRLHVRGVRHEVAVPGEAEKQLCGERGERQRCEHRRPIEPPAETSARREQQRQRRGRDPQRRIGPRPDGECERHARAQQPRPRPPRRVGFAVERAQQPRIAARQQREHQRPFEPAARPRERRLGRRREQRDQRCREAAARIVGALCMRQRDEADRHGDAAEQPRGIDEVHAESAEARAQQHPQQVAVALDAFASGPGQALAGEQSLAVAQRDECVVAEERPHGARLHREQNHGRHHRQQRPAPPIAR
jgi:hypothetical protein